MQSNKRSLLLLNSFVGCAQRLSSIFNSNILAYEFKYANAEI